MTFVAFFLRFSKLCRTLNAIQIQNWAKNRFIDCIFSIIEFSHVFQNKIQKILHFIEDFDQEFPLTYSKVK